MAFIDESKPSMAESEKKLTEQKEIDSIVKARGFDVGKYVFEPNPNIANRKDGSIANGVVRGRFTIENSEDFIVFEREAFPEKIWKRICSIMGFKYHVHTDIDKFVILPSAIDVHVSLVTPLQEE